MIRAVAVLVRRIADALRDLAPIVFVIAFFQIVVLQQPFPILGSIVIGLLCVIAGLTLFIQGLESGLFPLGEAIAQGFARKGSATALLAFAFPSRCCPCRARCRPVTRCACWCASAYHAQWSWTTTATPSA